jgi:peptidyl-prolyl cis-trans isomerase D
MLKLMRDSFKHLKWILLAVVAAFIFGFVFIDMGLGGAFGGNQPADTAYAARVNGETITVNDYYRALRRYEDMYKQMYGGNFTPEMSAMMGLPRQVVDTLIEHRLLIQEGRRMDLAATPEEIRRKLLEIPIFSENGKFIGMEMYTNYVTGPLGYASTAEFEEDLAREIALQKIDSALMSSVSVSPKAAEEEYRRSNENAKIRYVLMPASQQLASVTVTPAEVDAYYKANQTKYTHGEQRTIRYLLGDYAKLRQQLNPSEADLRRRYEASKEEYRIPESARVFHILVKVEETASPAEDAAAKAKAESLVAQLRAGADFATLARANSGDPSSAGNGGDMGYVEKGVTVPEFEQAIFSIPYNTISDPIRTKDFGYHIVKVTDRRPPGIRPFEEVRAMLAARAGNDIAQEQATNELNRLAAIFRDNKPKSVEAFVAYQNDKATANDSGWFQKKDVIPGIGNHPPLADWAFSAKEGDVSPVIGTPRGPAIAYLVSTRPAGTSALAEIRQKVEEDARQAKAIEAARARLAQLAAGATSIDAIAAAAGQTAREANISRTGAVAGINGDITPLVDAALAANIGEIKGPLAVRDGAVVMQVLEQKKVTPQEIAQNRATLIDTLRSQHARNLRQALLKRLRAASKIEVNEQLVNPQQTPQQQAGM